MDNPTSYDLQQVDRGLTRAIERDSSNLVARLSRGRVRTEQQRYADAASDLAAVIERTEDLDLLTLENFSAYAARHAACYLLGLLLADRLDKPEEGINRLDEAFQIADELECFEPYTRPQVEILYAKAKIYENQLNNPTEAILVLMEGIGLCEELLRQHPQEDFYWTAAEFGYLHRGRIQYMYGNREYANSDFQSAMAFASDRCEGHFNVSAMLSIAAPQEALQHLRSALEYADSPNRQQKVLVTMLAIQRAQGLEKYLH